MHWNGKRRSALGKKSTFGVMVGVIGLLAMGNSIGQAAVEFRTDDDDDKKAVVATIGKLAPGFTLTDGAGAEYSLSDYKGKIVVLEWYNPDCPYVKAGHMSGTLKDQGNEVDAAKDTVWLAINSGGKGTQGTGVEHNKVMAKKYKMDYPILFDESGVVGRSYAAAKTPHMYVIDAKGILRYSGAIDDDPFGRNMKAGKPVVNYVANALSEIAVGTEVTTTKTRPYGCNVHYAKLDGADNAKKGRGQRGGRGEKNKNSDNDSDSDKDSKKDKDDGGG